MHASQSYEVTIVGGGLGGLTAALALRQKGLRVTVLEQAPQLGEVGAGIQTAPNASRVLTSLGLRRQLEAIHTEPLDQVRRRWQDGSVIGLTSLGEHCKRTYNAPYWHYHRADLHKVLLEACLDEQRPGPAVAVHTGSRVTTVDTERRHRPVVLTESGQRYESDVVVGADGIRSAVRDLIGMPDTLEFSGEMAYRVLIPGDKIAADPATRWLVDRFQSTIWYGPGRHLVHYMIRGGEYLNVVALVPCSDEVAEKWSAPVGSDELVNAFPGWDDRVPAMLSKTEGDAMAFALYYRRPDPVWIDGHVALLGDACHAMLPYQAQGASQAMEDAAVLAEELGSVPVAGVEEALTRYVSRRAKHAAMVQDASLENKRFYHLPDGPDQRERDAKLKNFTGESHVSYQWLWSGTPLNDPDAESFAYQFPR
ncbi:MULTISPECIES: FAD-dependent monooxygenase [Prauserella salsuginis group]|uniref:Salicylate hydroxylase n=2 Tax=Prauserella salsuginis group TaxID=2893672 RepID=A0A839XJ49_9PSEU|nr:MULTISPECIES: FAD-dependent monooxygenase [Prauserella salsuginis group]MBB3663962.1 salicylate hydroxylase [Prauserella sediminis]MCR3721418.1 salicylate hydroxylase [Prauserella flava]MCR3732408.1 salicylate hydroxylase [Prauserella salsuginis]